MDSQKQKFDLSFSPKWRDIARDIYVPPDQQETGYLAVVYTDRVAFENKIIGEVPGIGIFRNLTSQYFKKKVADIIPNDLHSEQSLQNFQRFIPCALDQQKYEGRVAIVRRFESLPVIFYVFGYLTELLYKIYSKNPFLLSDTEKYYIDYLPEQLREGDSFLSPVIVLMTKGSAKHPSRLLRYDEAVNIINDWINQYVFVRYAGYTVENVFTQAYNASSAIYKRINNFGFGQNGYIISNLKLEFGVSRYCGDRKQVFLIGDINPDTMQIWDGVFFEPGHSETSIISDNVLYRFIKEHPYEPLPSEFIGQIYNTYKKIYNLFAPS